MQFFRFERAIFCTPWIWRCVEHASYYEDWFSKLLQKFTPSFYQKYYLSRTNSVAFLD